MKSVTKPKMLKVMGIILLQLSERYTVKKPQTKPNQQIKKHNQNPRASPREPGIRTISTITIFVWLNGSDTTPFIMEHCILHHYKSQGISRVRWQFLWQCLWTTSKDLPFLFLKGLVFSWNVELFKVRRVTSTKTNPYSAKKPYLLTAIHSNYKL